MHIPIRFLSGLCSFLCAAAIWTGTSSLPLHASDVTDPGYAKRAPFSGENPDGSFGSIDCQRLENLAQRRTIDFDDVANFPPGETLHSITLTDLQKDSEPLVIEFHAPNKNWWSINPDNQFMSSSPKQSLIVRDIPTTPDETYLTFSQPVHYVGFALCNVLNEKGDKIVFFKDAEGREIAETVEVAGGQKLTDVTGMPRGMSVFVGAYCKEGIRRVGFSFAKPNGSEKPSNRGIDDLSFQIED